MSAWPGLVRVHQQEGKGEIMEGGHFQALLWLSRNKSKPELIPASSVQRGALLHPQGL